eukprot:1159100-Pelagomonas_calceolata.AAC.5
MDPIPVCLRVHADASKQVARNKCALQMHAANIPSGASHSISKPGLTSQPQAAVTTTRPSSQGPLPAMTSLNWGSS